MIKEVCNRTTEVVNISLGYLKMIFLNDDCNCELVIVCLYHFRIKVSNVIASHQNFYCRKITHTTVLFPVVLPAFPVPNHLFVADSKDLLTPFLLATYKINDYSLFFLSDEGSLC